MDRPHQKGPFQRRLRQGRLAATARPRPQQRLLHATGHALHGRPQRHGPRHGLPPPAGHRQRALPGDLPARRRGLRARIPGFESRQVHRRQNPKFTTGQALPMPPPAIAALPHREGQRQPAHHAEPRHRRPAANDPRLHDCQGDGHRRPRVDGQRQSAD